MKPYLHVRAGLKACLSRAAFYRLIDYCEIRQERLVIESDGASFDLGSVVA